MSKSTRFITAALLAVLATFGGIAAAGSAAAGNGDTGVTSQDTGESR